ncbi:MAG: MaoC family dehydratase N-terminal domain-containing protein [Burkholderiales bacterium]|jgi:3-methylfumaryl-CoA hydratase|nr:MaoC family dehydratase N-terminal domain-containing protein [Burkholderiales bacterium]
MTSVDIDALRAWIGREELREDTITATPAVNLLATLDHRELDTPAGAATPPLAHWLYFLPLYRTDEGGPDGHARRGGFLPPVALPRRMWAGGRLEFRDPLRVGDRAIKRSTIADVSLKHGRAGALVFVLVRHEISTARGVAVIEEHDIVYRESAQPGEPASPAKPAPADAPWRRAVEPSALLLFRYSALTFNGHRIHYDRRYATEVEGYPGLVVHGPLMATLLLDLVGRERPNARVGRFEFRALRPVFDVAPFQVCGAPENGAVRLWIADADGALAMEGRAEFA